MWIPILVGGLAAIALLQPVAAHGGQYRGPGDLLPKKLQPIRGGTICPAPPTTHRVAPSARAQWYEPQPYWQFWWELNRDRFLSRRGFPVRRVLDAKSGASVVESAQALFDTLQSDVHGEVSAACVIALAKIGVDPPGAGLLSALSKPLLSVEQEVRESAALALGMSGRVAATALLIALAQDLPAGRAACGTPTVDARTRQFACYGLGLLGRRLVSVASRARVGAALRAVLTSACCADIPIDRDLAVAAVTGIRMIADQLDSRAEVFATLEAICEGVDTTEGGRHVRAHCVTALAQLLGRGCGPEREAYKARLLVGLSSGDELLAQSAAIALGFVCEPPEQAATDRAASRALVAAAGASGRPHVAGLAAMALARIGGAHHCGALLDLFRQRNERPGRGWLALALGVLVFEATETNPAEPCFDRVGGALQARLLSERDDRVRAAIALGIGLSGRTAAIGDLHEQLRSNTHRDELSGYLAIALALLRDESAGPMLVDLSVAAGRRPDVLKQTTLALGVLGHRDALPMLESILMGKTRSLAKLTGAAVGLGYMGDRKAAMRLINLLRDSNSTPLSRAFAAATLGDLGRLSPTPWSTGIVDGLNYRAGIATLADWPGGVLALL